MGRKWNRVNLWVRRQSHLPVVLICFGFVALLFVDDETSITRTRNYDAQIAQLHKDIKQAKDSAEFYRRARLDLQTNAEDLERVAREKYHMQRPTEDVYIIGDKIDN